MKRIGKLFALGLLVGLLVPGRPASAHDPTTWYIADWSDRTQNYKFVQGYPSESQYPGWRSRINDANTRWRNLAGNMSFTLGSGSDFAWYDYTRCFDDGKNGIFYANVADPALAVVYSCYTSTVGDTAMDTVQMVVDVRAFYTGTGTPPAGYFDLYSVAAHEWGHMYGRVTGGQIVDGATTGHWTESSSQCPSDSNRHTMCPTTPSGSTMMRTPATHDVDTFNSAYP